MKLSVFPAREKGILEAVAGNRIFVRESRFGRMLGYGAVMMAIMLYFATHLPLIFFNCRERPQCKRLSFQIKCY
jgi:hypothetical protein